MSATANAREAMILTQGIPSELLPDKYSPNVGKISIDKNFVISRDALGKPLSRYSDKYWDFSTYRIGKGNTRTYFDKHLLSKGTKRSQLAELHRKLLFSIMYYSSRSYSASTLMSRHYVIRSLMITVENLNLEISEIGQDDRLIEKVVLANAKKTVFLQAILDFFAELQSIPTLYLDIPHLSQRGFNSIKRAIQEKPESKQYAVIPQRLYLNLILGVENILTDFEPISEKLYSFLKMAGEDKAYARADTTQYNKYKLIASDAQPNFEIAASQHKLLNWTKERGINSLAGIVKYITYIQIAAKLGIHIFTGMRDSEAAHLTLDCLKVMKLGGKKVHILLGGTSKLSGQHIEASWVATKEAARAVEAATSVAKIIAVSANINIEDSANSPLFLSPAILPFIGNSHQNENPHFNHPVAKLDVVSELPRLCSLFSIDLKITEADIADMYITDPCRSWHDEQSFSLGKPWPLSSHQLRRSLAMYAANSGLVTLPSLKRQLKHISQEMTLYYARNSAFSPSFSKHGHISSEFSAQQDEVTTIALLKKVFHDDIRLFGVGGQALERVKETIHKPLFFSDKTETLKKVRNGELAFRETLLGGCIEPKSCSQGSFIAITSCINCKSAIFDSSSLEKIKVAISAVELEIELAKLGSFEHSAALSQLSDLKRLLDGIMKKNKFLKGD